MRAQKEGSVVDKCLTLELVLVLSAQVDRHSLNELIVSNEVVRVNVEASED